MPGANGRQAKETAGVMEHTDQHRSVTLAWEWLCKGPEAGMSLAEASSWSGEEGLREAGVTIRFGRATDTVKPVSSFLLWNVRPRRVGPSRYRVVLEVCPVPGKLLVGIALCAFKGRETSRMYPQPPEGHGG